MPNEIDEDLIETTIRRVAESKAARVDAPAIEMPVAESIAPVVGTSDSEDAGGEAAAIAARLGALKAVPRPADGEDSDVAPPPQSLRAQMQGLPAVPMQMSAQKPAPTRMPAPRPAPMQMPRPAPGDAVTDPAVASNDIAAQLRTIAQRLDAVLPLLERLAASQQAATAPDDGDWGRAPQASRAPISMPARPTVIRDTPPRASAGERAETDVIDTRPIPKPLPPLVEPKRGFDLLPCNYRITVEDKRRGVDLVPLHRAMLGVEGVRDMSLLSYNNGVAIVALETTDELDPEVLRSSVSRAMSREARVEVHNENTMVLKLSDE